MIVFSIGFVILTLLTGIWDFLFYRIPNLFISLLFLLFIAMALVTGGYDYAFLTLGFITTLVIGFILASFNIIGPGDAKLLAVLSLWIMHVHLMGVYLLVLCLLSGILGVVYFFCSQTIDSLRQGILTILKPLFKKIPFCEHYLKADFKVAYREKRLHTQVPFGLAISLGALFIVF